MADDYANHSSGLESPPRGGFAITPHNTNPLPKTTRAIWVGTAGDGTLKVTTEDGSVLEYTSVPAGRFVIRASIVWATGTGVSALIGEY